MFIVLEIIESCQISLHGPPATSLILFWFVKLDWCDDSQIHQTYFTLPSDIIQRSSLEDQRFLWYLEGVTGIRTRDIKITRRFKGDMLLSLELPQDTQIGYNVVSLGTADGQKPAK